MLLIFNERPGVTFCSPGARIAIDRKNTNVIFAGTVLGVLKSTNGGASWVSARAGLRSNLISLAVDPSDSNLIFGGDVYSRVHMSTNGGETWSQANDGLPGTGNIQVAVDPSGAGIVYAGTGGASIFKRQFKSSEIPR